MKPEEHTLTFVFETGAMYGDPIQLMKAILKLAWRGFQAKCLRCNLVHGKPVEAPKEMRYANYSRC